MVAVIGVPDKYYIEEIMACLVLKENATETVENIKIWSQKNLGKHKYPRKIKLFKQLPLTSTRKILKRALKEMI